MQSMCVIYDYKTEFEEEFIHRVIFQKFMIWFRHFSEGICLLQGRIQLLRWKLEVEVLDKEWLKKPGNGVEMVEKHAPFNYPSDLLVSDWTLDFIDPNARHCLMGYLE